jgi:hypothetical protein
VFEFIKACGLVVQQLFISSVSYTQCIQKFVFSYLYKQLAVFCARQNQTVLHSQNRIFQSVNIYLNTLSTVPTTKTTLKLTKYRSIV